MHIARIIESPLLNEKLNKLRQHSNKVIFKVNPDSNKLEIKKAVEFLFSVKVIDVRTMNVKGKIKRRGAKFGRTPEWKKAIITLEKDNKIEYFEGM